VRPRGHDNASARTRARPRGRDHASAQTRKNKNKNKNKFINFFLFFGSCCRLGKGEFFSIFGFRFSIPKIPKIPKIPELSEFHGLRVRSREKKKAFSA
jgi:hypothetical protein